MKNKLYAFFILWALSSIAQANEWVYDVKVAKLGAYQHAPNHFVWLSQKPSECSSTLSFSEDKPGGKALMSVLMTAVISKVSVDVQVNGCDIVEVYLK